MKDVTEALRHTLKWLKLYRRVNASLDWYMPKEEVPVLVRLANMMFRLTVPGYKEEALQGYLESEKYKAENADVAVKKGTEEESEHEP